MKSTVVSGLLAILGLATAIVVRNLPVSDEGYESATLDTLRKNGAI